MKIITEARLNLTLSSKLQHEIKEWNDRLCYFDLCRNVVKNKFLETKLSDKNLVSWKSHRNPIIWSKKYEKVEQNNRAWHLVKSDIVVWNKMALKPISKHGWTSRTFCYYKIKGECWWNGTSVKRGDLLRLDGQPLSQTQCAIQIWRYFADIVVITSKGENLLKQRELLVVLLYNFIQVIWFSEIVLCINFIKDH